MGGGSRSVKPDSRDYLESKNWVLKFFGAILCPAAGLRSGGKTDKKTNLKNLDILKYNRSLHFNAKTTQAIRVN